ncbi:MAG: alanine--tRNA ligase [Candidatus Sumerlaeota bacterium]|nr:alanine--tRNA ligase [Candidatus Sumerlaeota bacterium]
MKGSELRRLFLDYFVERGHRLIPSAPLIPPDDPSLLFTNAGMVQFKRLYAGEVEPLPYSRACSVQKCLRAGGKGSDLENVGRTLRHHTFFEMLGNFSFGDYFKREAIAWGWDFVTNVMQLPVERLFVSIYEEDAEAADIWEREQGIPRSRIIPLDAKENFWGPAGDTGACGPCSEIIFFMGTETELAQAQRQDTLALTRRLSKEGDLFFEIWNMVFPQFNQRRDGSRIPLKYRGIDTGAGLERMLTAMNFIDSNGAIGSPYETDLLWDIVKRAAELTGLEYVKRFDPLAGRDLERTSHSRLALNAVADHTRALVFALSEGIIPSNEGRGYVLRRIQRRALRFVHLLGVEQPFMYQLVQPVIDLLGDAWHEIKKYPDHVMKVIRLEEEHFLKTLAQGESILDELIAKAKAQGAQVLSGADVFKLHATYGYPIDLTAEVASDAGLKIDRSGYEEAMKCHREEAKKSWRGAVLENEADLLSDIFEQYGPTEYLRTDDSGRPVFECDPPVIAILKNGGRTVSAFAGDEIALILEKTCFYGEAGGQGGDTGIITLREEGRTAEIIISETFKTPSGIHLHKGSVTSGEVCVGDIVHAAIDAPRRLAIMRNHTATHLLQAALRRVVGTHIAQQGSSVEPEGFRFDFANPEPLTPEQILEVERLVQKEILNDTPVETREMPLEEARQIGAIAPFGEKYGALVWVVKIGDFSLEFCGGAHCRRTGEIGTFIIVNESSIASGVRRIESKTGMAAFEMLSNMRDAVRDLSRLLSATQDALAERVGNLLDEIKEMKKEIKRLRQEKASGSVDDVLATARETGGIRFVTHQTEGLDSDEMRNLADELRARLKEGVVVIGSTDGEKVSLVCTVTEGVKKKAPAGKIIREVAKIVGGKGGGRDDMAQAGGRFPEKLPEALAAVENILKSILH